MNDPDNPSPVLRFYLGQAPDHAGRWFEDILRWDNHRLEATHDSIQWLFPLLTRSAFAGNAPLLSATDLQQFRTSPLLQRNVLRALDRLLKFYGIVLCGSGEDVDCQEAADFEARRRLWLTPENHHYARLTRILRSLVLLGFAAHAEALADFLYLLHRRYPAFITANTWNRWRETVEFHE
jgi:hypothetical protein